MGSATLLFVLLLLPPIYVKARIDSLRIDEETPFNWDEFSFRAQVGGLLGAAQLGVEHQAGTTTTQLRLLGFTKPLRSASPDKGAKQEGEHRSARGRRFRRSQSEATDRRGSPGKQKRKSGKKRPVSLSQLRQLLPEAAWLIKKAFQQFKLAARGRLTYGFSDPFATAIAHRITTSLPPMPELRLQPDYAQGVLEGWVELDLRIYPWQAVLLGIQLLFRPGVRSLWWSRVKNALRIKPKPIKEVINT